ncbi:hypothetical protein MCEGEM3_02204 [Oxalobacteraceae bacterium]
MIFFVLNIGCANAERTRDIVIRDFNKGVSALALNEDQKKKWDAVISTIFNLHEKLGGYGKWSKAQSPWIQYPGHWFVTRNPNVPAGQLITKYVDIQVEDYRRVVKAHIDIHEKLEEFDDSLDSATRKRFRSNFRDIWAWVYDKMTDQIEDILKREISGTRSYFTNLRLSKDQKNEVEALLEKLEEANNHTKATKSQGRKDLWAVMNSPEIPWSKSPMMCKSYFESYALTMAAYASVVKDADELLNDEQKAQFQKILLTKYQKELDYLVTQKM